ncbi:MAG TPA: TetR/AcrR family transcriptional regulator [Candidatus Hydrogenedentes bacterium]|jgi:AcrR family transcriptional regulator|nr:MAG: Biofilm operon icaADBC HTH-type negative transcriptional regulator IcaR [Candidatus Hydrogenedentes bacterium ADurb.Bin170]HNZ47426.1 TetR/AcrR family transcriptional regulator [Candidatus Hydrogenedentota bacterium]HOD94226.1 TetR/AcrR family transcriptional regulator [Candidatus Hydrogenedentota bacterium]HOM47423.1 TetR/AcrR family transcriptional regulator [Candidatus Hydrogenedentota bacterium]HOR49633.1 TetR/AcrR family transcriptional regulator [Candidatus Hydrogenedentota bacter
MDNDFTEIRETNEAETRLLESALQLFSEKGYEGTSIREIIEGAGVTRPVLYYYFTNKEDLFRKLLEPALAKYTRTLADIRENYSDAVGRLKAIARATFRFAEENPQAVRLVLQLYFAPPKGGPRLDKTIYRLRRFRFLEEIMQEGLEKGELAGGDAQGLALALIGMMDTFVTAKSYLPDTHLSEEAAEGLIDLFYFGACYKENPPSILTSPFKYI